MPVNLRQAVKGAAILLSLFFGSITLTIVAVSVFLTVTTTVYASLTYAGASSPTASTVRDLLSIVSTPKAVENLNMGNIALAAAYVLLLVLIVLVDSVLREAVEGLRQKAKLPIVETIQHYNQNSYDIPLARASSQTYPRLKNE